MGVSENKMDLPHLCLCVTVSASMCVSVTALYFLQRCVVRCYTCYWWDYRDIIVLFCAPLQLFTLCILLVCVCVCAALSLIRCDCIWHVVCAGAVNRRAPNCDSSPSLITAPGAFSSSEDLSMDNVFAYGLTNAHTDTHS